MQFVGNGHMAYFVGNALIILMLEFEYLLIYLYMFMYIYIYSQYEWCKQERKLRLGSPKTRSSYSCYSCSTLIIPAKTHNQSDNA